MVPPSRDVVPVFLAAGRVVLRETGGVRVPYPRMAPTGQTAPDGAMTGPPTAILVFVPKRRAEGWACICAQDTDVVPGAGTRVARAGRKSAQDHRWRPGHRARSPPVIFRA
jgi:hypothetical protein